MDNPKARAVTGEDFHGWMVDDQPYVDNNNFSDVNEMLSELGRRIEKSGRLDQHENSRRYTKPSKQRREKQKAQAYRAKTGAERRWRGGVRC